MNTRSELWAKRTGFDVPYPLLAHMLDTACVAGALYDHWLRSELRELIQHAFGDKARNIVQFVLGAHDVGKATPRFQLQLGAADSQWNEIRSAINASGHYQDLHPRTVLRNGTKRFIRRHEQNSAYYFADNFLRGDNRIEDIWKSVISGGHHGRFEVPDLSSVEREDYQEQIRATGWRESHEDLLSLLALGCDVDQNELPETVFPVVTVLLSGLVILADRIASGERWVQGGQNLMNAGEISLENPRQWIEYRYGAAVSRVDATVGLYHPWENDDAAYKAILQGYQPRPAQQAALETGDGLWSLMATTGVGKTEAALLRHSLRSERLIFLLPTQATSNAIMNRVRKAFAETSNVASLAHLLASLEDFYEQPLSIFDDSHDDPNSINTAKECGDLNPHQDPTGLYPSSFVKSGSARLLAPVCVGTIDQALIGGLPGKWIHLTLLALANSHIVIDEVHTLDQYQTKLLEGLMPWLAATNTRVTFLTATLPSWQREVLTRAYGGKSITMAPASFPSAESVTQGQQEIVCKKLETDRYVIGIDLRKVTHQNLVESHIKWFAEQRREYPNSRIGIICNTVQRARDIAKAIEETGESVVVLHSNMTAKHRQEAADKMLNEIGPGGTAKKITIVGTQAIEASLDIDLDLLNTELCPAPSLIQRAGRLWRRADDGRSARVPRMQHKVLTVTYFDDDESGKYLPYLAAEIKRSASWLEKHGAINVPGDCQDFIDASTVSFDDARTDQDIEALADQALKTMKGENNRVDLRKLLGEEAEYGELQSMTGAVTPDERATRLIDQGHQYSLILGGDPDVVPGAQQWNVDQLLKIRASDKERVRKVMKASMNVRLSFDKDKAANYGLVALSDANSLLRGYWYLPDSQRFYDAVTGFDRSQISASAQYSEN
ncbi:CRISPR-associated endonuclease/helicase Cas3 [Arcanobacterium pluranimalium]|uniref:CRISPR-associated helicase Cas3' n=1 Tax=Arcanobacterium pluranimalium TaxID=108028 RepID=UPI001956EE28|nr:CRISPR-associated endonuclease/helicase Cas3 [Arcanobacterium pluranimalium]